MKKNSYKGRNSYINESGKPADKYKGAERNARETESAEKKPTRGNLEGPLRASEDPQNRKYAERNTKSGLKGSNFMNASIDTPLAECDDKCEKMLDEGMYY